MRDVHATEKLINVEGLDGVLRSIWWWGHCRDSSGGAVAFVGGEGVECCGDDVMCLPLQEDVALRDEISG